MGKKSAKTMAMEAQASFEIQEDKKERRRQKTVKILAAKQAVTQTRKVAKTMAKTVGG